MEGEGVGDVPARLELRIDVEVEAEGVPAK